MTQRTTGASKDYKFSQKNHWRRTIWNDVLRRTNGREKDEYILYLAGPQDLDREIAIAKGVPARNLIAIDLSEPNVRRVRAKGAPAVTGDITDVLWSWPKSRPVCAVFLDFCGGLSMSNFSVYDVFERPSLRKAAIMVNLMRGRDPVSNEMREQFAAMGFKTFSDQATGQEIDVLKNRAAQFLLRHMWEIVTMAVIGRDAYAQASALAPSGRIPLIASPDREQRIALRQWIIDLASGVCRMKLVSYKSGPLTFDSVVFEHHLARAPMDFGDGVDVKGEAISSKEVRYKISSVARQIAAQMAWRTTRAAQARHGA